MARRARQRCIVDDCRSAQGEHPLGLVSIAFEEPCRRNESKHGVPEKLHAFVRLATAFARKAFVHECLLHEREISGGPHARKPQQRAQAPPVLLASQLTAPALCRRR
jgi:hypothetical protein